MHTIRIVLLAIGDVVEEDPLKKAVSENEQLRRAMYEEYDNEPIADNQFGARIRRFRDIRRRMRAIDAIGWEEVQETMEEYLPIDTKLKEWDSLEEYLDLRKIHAGNTSVIFNCFFRASLLTVLWFSYSVTAALIRWSMGIHLTDEEHKVAQPYTDACGIFNGLMNDYISWKRERTQPTDRIVNFVNILMKKYKLPEDIAIDTTRGMIVKQEFKVQEMGKELHSKTGTSTGLRAYLNALEYCAGGTFYWSLFTPRYNAPLSFDV